MSVALHTPSTIFSWRHAPTWMLLAFGAGSVNAGAFLACQSFVSHVTGTATKVGMDTGIWAVMMDYGFVILFFIFGAMTSVLALDGRHHRGKAPLHALPLLLVSLLLAGVALAGTLGAFGPFGQTVEQSPEFLLLMILAFAMGLQNATVATTTGLAVRTTHMTGPASDLGVHLATAYFASGEARRAALKGAALRFGKMASFILGAAVIVPVAREAEYLAFLLPACIVLLATALSFVPAWSRPDPAPAAPATS